VTRPAEIEHNLSALKSLSSWVNTYEGMFSKAPTAMCWSPTKDLGVKLEPAFGIKTSAGTRVVTLWNAKTSELNQRVAGISIYLMQKHLPLSEHPNCECAILGLRKKKLYVSIKVPTNVASMVASEFAWVDQFFETMKQVA
jgi:hypothetical protein